MKSVIFEDKKDWYAGRLGKITGSRLKDVLDKTRGTGKKIGFYELIAERLGIPADDEDERERGNRLEPVAIKMFEAETGETVDTSLVIWMRDDNESIAISPDGHYNEYEDAVEAKCLASARHIEAYLTKKIPAEYIKQGIQYFVVNDKCQRVHFTFYDPRLLAKPFFIITLHRADLQTEIIETLAAERDVLSEVTLIVNELSNF